MRAIELSLPEFAFVDSAGHEVPDVLAGRTIILHVRSASVLEVLERDDAFLNDGTLAVKFNYTNRFGFKERLLMALHYSATLDRDTDRETIIDEVMKPAARWYADYCDWEDRNED